MRGDRIGSLCGALLAFFILWQAVQVDVGSIHEPGPGFFMFLAALLLAACSFIVYGQSLRRPKAGQDSPRVEKKGRLPLTGYILGILVLYALMLEILGFIITTFLLVLSLLRILEPKPWWKLLLTAGLTSGGAYVIFNFFLKAGLPAGILGLLPYLVELDI